MKHILLTAFAAVMFAGCVTTESQEKTPKAEPPNISIHKAASIGDIEAVRQHLAAGTDPNLKYPVVHPPLLFAVGYEVMTLLVENGADVNDIGLGMTALHRFADPKSVRYLVDKVADVNAIDKFGDTPLHKMVEGYLWKQKESVEILIAAGADVNAFNFDGMTPLDNFLTNHIAAPREDKLFFEFEKLLRKHGAKTSEELRPWDKEKAKDEDDNNGLDFLIGS